MFPLHGATMQGTAAVVEGSSLPPSNGARHAQLVHAAQQFEAVMLGELMKPLSRGSAIGEDSEEQSSNPMQSYGVEAMAGALARSGALGFAAKMVRSVEAHEARTLPENDGGNAKGIAETADNPDGGYQR